MIEPPRHYEMIEFGHQCFDSAISRLPPLRLRKQPRGGCGELRYLDEIGHLATPQDSRTSVQFNHARVLSTNGDVVFDGHDDAGKRCRATRPIVGGVGFINVWQADFDRNSRSDLLIAAHSSGIGTVMLDGEDGREIVAGS